MEKQGPKMKRYAEKAEFMLINEHVEPDFTVVFPGATVFQRPAELKYQNNRITCNGN